MRLRTGHCRLVRTITTNILGRLITVPRLGPMETNTSVNSRMANDTGKAPMRTMTDAYTWASGKTA